MYTIVNKPTWATFDTTTGKLTGKPDVNSSNTYKDIVISVSDGIDTTTLSNFDIVVSPNIIGNIESKYYGKWIEAQSGDELSIDTTTILEYTAPNDDQLEIDINNTSKKYLRASLSKINLKGQLTKRTTTVRGLRDYATIGDIDVILQNVLDPNIKATITTDTNGYFEDTSLPAGDYTIQANSNDIQIDTTISISDEQEDLGTFVLLEEDTHNFKAELFLNESFIIADGKMQNATIKVKNIGAKKSLGTNFSIKLIDENNNTINPADINYSDNTNDVVGSIFPDTTADINVSFAFEPIYKNNKDITIELSIMDADNNKWTETMKFVLYKGTFDINVATSQANVRGYIRLPYNKQILAIDMANGTLTLPLLQPTSHYPLVLANSNELEGETKYSIGIETKTEDFSNFSYTGIYEQNSVENPYGDDTEATANPIKLYESAKAYIHYGDLDYWKITTQEDDTKLHYDDNFETILNPTIGDTITSNAITITDSSISTVTVDSNASLVLNGTEVNLSNIAVSLNDQVAIKLTVPTFTSNMFVTMNTDTNISRILRIGKATASSSTNGTITHNSITYGTVTSPYTGKVWLDRNLGASQVCTAYNDTQCYGDYYQWGRETDGHEKSTSYKKSAQAGSVTNAGDKFITSTLGSSYDWAYNADSDGALRSVNWSKTDGTSICPAGYRVPTESELKAETTDSGVSNITNAFDNFLKLPSAGYRENSDGSMGYQGSISHLWSVSVCGNYGCRLRISSGDANWDGHRRANGYSVRCLRD